MPEFFGVANHTNGEADLIGTDYSEVVSPTGVQSTAIIRADTDGDNNYLTITPDQGLADGTRGNQLKLVTETGTATQAYMRIYADGSTEDYVEVRFRSTYVSGADGNDWDLELEDSAITSFFYLATTMHVRVLYVAGTATLNDLNTAAGTSGNIDSVVVGDGTLLAEGEFTSRQFSGGTDGDSYTYDADTKTLTVMYPASATLSDLETGIDGLTNQFSASLTGTSDTAEDAGFERDFGDGQNNILQQVLLSTEHDCWVAVTDSDTAPADTDTGISFQRAGLSFMQVPIGYYMWAKVAGSADADASVEVYREDYDLTLLPE